MAQEYAVEIQLKYFLLVQCALDFDGQQNFIELAHEGAIQGEEVVARYLHGQGAAAGAFFAGQHQFRNGAHQAHQVDAAVAEKIVVFGRQQGLDELLGDCIEGQWAALLLAELADQLAVAGVHPHGCLQFDVAQGFDIRQVGAEVKIDAREKPQCTEKPE